MYIVNLEKKEKVIWFNDFDKNLFHTNTEINKYMENIQLKIFSQIYGCLPFKYVDNYPMKGYFPDVPKNIKEMKNVIDDNLVNKIYKNINEKYYSYFFIIIDYDGNNVFSDVL